MLFESIYFKLRRIMATMMGTLPEVVHPAIIQQEFVFKKAPFKSCHASTITEEVNGSLLCAYFAGTKEGNADVAIWISSRENGTWSQPRKVAEKLPVGIRCFLQCPQVKFFFSIKAEET